MLDQNTDRMWYVIGAVIVGAALIFLMNSTFPGLFGTIGETFEGKVEQTTEMTDGIAPITRPLLTPRNVEAAHKATYVLDDENSLSKGVLTVNNPLNAGANTGGLVLRQDKVHFKPNTTYIITFDYQKVSGSLLSFGGHIDEPLGLRGETKTMVDGVQKPTDLMNHYSMHAADDTNRHSVRIELHTKDNPGPADALWIQPNRGRATQVVLTIFDLRMTEVN